LVSAATQIHLWCEATGYFPLQMVNANRHLVSEVHNFIVTGAMPRGYFKLWI